MKMRKDKRGWMAVKTGLENAHDNLECDFTLHTLKKQNLDSNTCNLIMSCITSKPLSS